MFQSALGGDPRENGSLARLVVSLSLMRFLLLQIGVQDQLVFLLLRTRDDAYGIPAVGCSGWLRRHWYRPSYCSLIAFTGEAYVHSLKGFNA